MKAKSTEELKKTGSYRRSRHGNRLEAPCLENVPDPPEGLNQAASTYWYKKASELLDLGQLHKADEEPLKRLCILYAAQDTIVSQMNEAWGNELFSSKLKELEKVAKLITPLERDFGLSPVARTKIKVERKDKNEFEEF
jgi:phage terminase small subunit